MYTSYSIEKVASSNRRDALTAAEAGRLARAFRSSTGTEARPASPASGVVRIPRPRRWFGLAAAQ